MTSADRGTTRLHPRGEVGALRRFGLPPDRKIRAAVGSIAVAQGVERHSEGRPPSSVEAS